MKAGREEQQSAVDAERPVKKQLLASWDRCWRMIGATGDGHDLLARLIAAYNEPQRKYHSEQHLTECLELFDRHRALAVEPAEVEMALWFHDAIYDTRVDDNEAKSAAWAADELRQAGVGPERISRVVDLILATRHEALPQGRDQKLLVDIDLAILGADLPRFEEYESQVREEYSWVPDAIFLDKRRKVLSGFLARNPLYNTPRLREHLEHQARCNLERSLR